MVFLKIILIALIHSLQSMSLNVTLASPFKFLVSLLQDLILCLIVLVLELNRTFSDFEEPIHAQESFIVRFAAEEFLQRVNAVS